MITDPSTGLLWAVLGLTVAIALGARAYALIALSVVLLTLIPDDWEVSNVRVDATDIVIACIALSLILRSRKERHALRDTPHLALWVTLGVCASLAYLVAPQNGQYLTNIVRALYQLYRYSWKPILFYAIGAMLLVDRRALVRSISVIILTADIAALIAIPQGYAGREAVGPFTHHNALGGSLIIPIVLVCPESPRHGRGDVVDSAW